MTRNVLKTAAVALLVLVLNGCSTDKKIANPTENTPEIIPIVNIEPVKGKINVYTSMARAVKYNIDVSNKNLYKTVFSEEINANPKEAIRRVLNVKTGGENQLYDAVRVLDFSVVYAISNVSENKTFVENNIYAKSAHKLAMAAI